MKRKLLNNALNEIRDDQVAEAASARKKRPLLRISAIAAVLAAAILVSSIQAPEPAVPLASAKGLLASPVYPQMAQYPIDNSNDMDAYSAHWESVRALHNQPLDYATGTEDFFQKSMVQFLSDDSSENQVYSPLNVYMALAMLAETTDGHSRKQILNLLGSKNIKSLRTQAEHMWKAHYWNDGLSTSILANSLWLDSDYSYNPETVQTLADQYYASVFSGDLGSDEMNKTLQSWLNEQTHGLLKEQANRESFDPRTTLALASTFYYKVQWGSKFNEEENTQGIFHTPGADVDATYMNKTLFYGGYYWGDTFGAVCLNLEDGSNMWLVLPDQGVSPKDVLHEDSLYAIMRQSYLYPDHKDVIVNLSVPKFDVVSKQSLVSGLKALGVTDVFQEGVADFSPIIPQQNGDYVSEISHAARVGIDEDGVIAAAYTVILAAGAGMPPEEEIDFVLDRPFLFVIADRDGIPLFSGVVNQP